MRVTHKNVHILLFSLCLFWFFVLTGFSDTSVRFQSDVLQSSFNLFMLLLLPASFFWGAYQGNTRTSKTLYSIAGTFVLLVAILPAILLASDLKESLTTGHKRDLTVLDKKLLNNHYYYLYETSGDATVDFGILLQREDLFLGLKLIHRIKSVYHAKNAKLELLPTGKARLTVEPYNQNQQGLVFEFSP